MKLYFAAELGFLDLLASEGVRDVLIPYVTLRAKEKHLAKLEGFNVFLDCGAWSVFSGAVDPIDVHAYTDWVRRVGFRFEKVAALDVIGNAEESRANYHTMRDAGIECLPTWHAGESMELAEEYARDADTVAIGGLAGRSRRSMASQIINGVWSRLRHRNVHLFGMTNIRVMAKFFPHSVDATTWLTGQKFGTLLKVNSDSFTRVPIVGPHFDRQAALELTAQAQRVGIPFSELLTSYNARNRYNIRVLSSFVDKLNRDKTT